jgi:hypothetical protein
MKRLAHGMTLVFLPFPSHFSSSLPPPFSLFFFPSAAKKSELSYKIEIEIEIEREREIKRETAGERGRYPHPKTT